MKDIGDQCIGWVSNSKVGVKGDMRGEQKSGVRVVRRSTSQKVDVLLTSKAVMPLIPIYNNKFAAVSTILRCAFFFAAPLYY